jgi:ATP adenylyltransferase
MERLWAPWRMEYILAEKPDECILCVGTDTARDRERLVLYRTSLSTVMLNRFPYSNGHLMVSPLRHTAGLDALDDTELLDLMKTVRLCCRILYEIAAPQGINVGINIGQAAGAGVDDHLHLHVVPRWSGDTNFMTVVGDLRVMPENLLTSYDRLLPSFAALTEG